MYHYNYSERPKVNLSIIKRLNPLSSKAQVQKEIVSHFGLSQTLTSYGSLPYTINVKGLQKKLYKMALKGI